MSDIAGGVQRGGERQARVDQANTLVQTISEHGRRFFRHGDRVGRFELDGRGRVWWVDEHSGRRIYTHSNHRWRGFNNGGTLRHVVERLRDYITRGELLPARIFGPWPDYICGGDLWGYGEHMAFVRACARDLGIIAEATGPATVPPEIGQ